jgi:hypothetical protein
MLYKSWLDIYMLETWRQRWGGRNVLLRISQLHRRTCTHTALFFTTSHILIQLTSYKEDLGNEILITAQSCNIRKMQQLHQESEMVHGLRRRGVRRGGRTTQTSVGYWKGGRANEGSTHRRPKDANVIVVRGRRSTNWGPMWRRKSPTDTRVVGEEPRDERLLNK